MAVREKVERIIASGMKRWPVNAMAGEFAPSQELEHRAGYAL